MVKRYLQGIVKRNLVVYLKFELDIAHVQFLQSVYQYVTGERQVEFPVPDQLGFVHEHGSVDDVPVGNAQDKPEKCIANGEN